jgi:hypothetical protein
MAQRFEGGAVEAQPEAKLDRRGEDPEGAVTFGYIWLLSATFGYIRLHSVIFRYFRLHSVTFGYS